MNSYIKKYNPFPPPPTANLHVEKTPSLKTPFPTQPSTSPRLPPAPHLNFPAPTAPKEQNQDRRFPLQHAQEKRRRKKSERYAKTTPILPQPHTHRQDAEKTDARKKSKKTPLAVSAFSLLKRKKRNSVYIHDRLGNRW